MGVTKESFVWILVVGVCMNAAYTLAWGTYICDLKEQGLQKIGEICSESVNKLQSPLSALENKMERVLDFVEEIKTAEDSWLHVTKKTGLVERDLSLHEESNKNERDDEDRRSEQETSNQDNANKERNQSRQETNQNRNRTGEQTRIEDDYRQGKRERTNEDYWQNRTERTDEDDSQNRRQRTNENDSQNRREQRGDDEDTRRNMDSLEKLEENDDDDKGPKKGECVTQTMDIHETIGMFYMMSYQHGHCANRNPIVEPVRYCLGFCTSRTFIDREAGNWSQGSDCKSCQATKFETIRIPLACDDGFTFEKKFKNVVNCRCRRCQTVENKKRRP